MFGASGRRAIARPTPDRLDHHDEIRVVGGVPRVRPSELAEIEDELRRGVDEQLRLERRFAGEDPLRRAPADLREEPLERRDAPDARGSPFLERRPEAARQPIVDGEVLARGRERLLQPDEEARVGKHRTHVVRRLVPRVLTDRVREPVDEPALDLERLELVRAPIDQRRARDVALLTSWPDRIRVPVDVLRRRRKRAHPLDDDRVALSRGEAADTHRRRCNVDPVPQRPRLEKMVERAHVPSRARGLVDRRAGLDERNELRRQLSSILGEQRSSPRVVRRELLEPFDPPEMRVHPAPRKIELVVRAARLPSRGERDRDRPRGIAIRRECARAFSRARLPGQELVRRAHAERRGERLFRVDREQRRRNAPRDVDEHALVRDPRREPGQHSVAVALHEREVVPPTHVEVPRDPRRVAHELGGVLERQKRGPDPIALEDERAVLRFALAFAIDARALHERTRLAQRHQPSFVRLDPRAVHGRSDESPLVCLPHGPQHT